MRKKILLRIIGITIVVLSSIAITFAWNRSGWTFNVLSDKKAAAAETSDTKGLTESDKTTLKRLFGILSGAMNSSEIAVNGSISMFDPADSSATGKKPFTYVRKGIQCYYALGEVEMISLKDMYIVCNNETRRIIISGPREIVAPVPVQGDDLISTFVQDGYSLKSNAAGDDSLFVVSCPNHIECKEYSYRTNMDTKEVHELRLRLTDITDPLNASKDKEISIRMDKWSTTAETDVFRREKYLLGNKGHFSVAPAYNGYEIVSSL